MYKWSLLRNVNLDLVYMIFFAAIAFALIFGIDFIYKKIKKKL